MENWRKFTNEAHNYPHNLELKRKRCEGKPKTGDCAPNPPDEEAKKRIAQNEEVDEALTEEEGCWDGYSPGAQTGKKTKKGKKGNRVNNCEEITEDEVKDKYGDEVQTGYRKKSAKARSEMELEEKKKKEPCKPQKGKRYAKRVDGKCRSFGQAGKSKDGKDRIQPGTEKGHAYCARSAEIPKCDDPPCPNDLSRKKWKCQGDRSVP
jgi:hypothetical protein